MLLGSGVFKKVIYEIIEGEVRSRKVIISTAKGLSFAFYAQIIKVPWLCDCLVREAFAGTRRTRISTQTFHAVREDYAQCASVFCVLVSAKTCSRARRT